MFSESRDYANVKCHNEQNNFPTRVDPINLPRRLREGLEKADNLLSGNEPQQALDLLEELDKKFPRQPEVLSLKAMLT